MIVRIWSGKVKKGAQVEFENFVREHDIPILNSQDGCTQAFVARKSGSENDPEYVIISLWKDMDSLRKFTGPEWEKPVPGNAEKILVTATPEVNHFVVI